MSEQSPTGTPRMKPARVPLYLAVAIAASAGFTAASQMLPESYALARVVCAILAVAISTFTGTVSPGLRRQ